MGTHTQRLLAVRYIFFFPAYVSLIIPKGDSENHAVYNLVQKQGTVPATKSCSCTHTNLHPSICLDVKTKSTPLTSTTTQCRLPIHLLFFFLLLLLSTFPHILELRREPLLCTPCVCYLDRAQRSLLCASWLAYTIPSVHTTQLHFSKHSCDASNCHSITLLPVNQLTL